jgi:hypothetical protein
LERVEESQKLARCTRADEKNAVTIGEGLKLERAERATSCGERMTSHERVLRRRR